MSAFASCNSVLAQENTYDNATTFGEGAGSIYIVESTACWADVQGDIENSIAYAEIGIAALEALHYPTDTILD